MHLPLRLTKNLLANQVQKDSESTIKIKTQVCMGFEVF